MFDQSIGSNTEVGQVGLLGLSLIFVGRFKSIGSVFNNKRDFERKPAPV